MSYINRQGGTRSCVLHGLAHRLIIWSDRLLLSLSASHVDGIHNKGRTCCQMGRAITGNGRCTQPLQNRSGIGLDGPKWICLLHKTTRNDRCFHDAGKAPLGMDALAHKWPRTLLYVFPPLSLISPTLQEIRD